MWMGLWPDGAVFVVWDIWIVTWIAAALWANRTVKTPNIAREIPYRFLTLAGFMLLLFTGVRRDGWGLHFTNAPGWLGARAWPPPPLAVGWSMVALAALGVLFAWWARIYLGRLWSGRITRKEGHHIVDAGPYGLVRHPIYTGLLTAAIATAVATGFWHTILGALLMILGYWMKARLEEKFLRAELGAADYDAYATRVPMLVPFFSL